ncbi:Sec-independent protein translocase protein TatB [Sphingobium mellinum]|uniref:Sec-independent protein translocase protein TatB n=1 Tax=Sphingobium mellinum TaxID=1387166 RepID=UPI0030ECCD1C
MFDIGSSEFLLIVIVAVVVIGPKDLPRALYKVGQIVGKARGMARHFRTGIDAMVREVEMEELEKKWGEQNRRIMQEHPPESIPAAPQMEPLPAPRADAPPPPFVAQSAPAPGARPASAADGPPYIATNAGQGKGDAPA